MVIAMNDNVNVTIKKDDELQNSKVCYDYSNTKKWQKRNLKCKTELLIN